MKNWSELKKELLKDKKVRQEYDLLKPKYQIISQIIEARVKSGLTQEQIAQKIGSKQSVIARLESGKSNPTISFLDKIAHSLNKELKINLS